MQTSRKMIVMPASRMSRAISLGVFWRLAPSTMAIMRSKKVSPGLAVMRTTSQSDKHAGAAGHAAAVAAALADHRGALARDGALVDRGDAVDHFAVDGNVVAGLDEHHVALAQVGGQDHGHVAALEHRLKRAARGAARRADERTSWPKPRAGRGAGRRPGPFPAPRPSPRRNWRTTR